MSEQMFDVNMPVPRKWVKNPVRKATGFYYRAEIRYTPEGALEPVWHSAMLAPIVWTKSVDYHTFEAVVAQGLAVYVAKVITRWNSYSTDVRYIPLTKDEYEQEAFGVPSFDPFTLPEEPSYFPH